MTFFLKKASINSNELPNTDFKASSLPGIKKVQWFLSSNFKLAEITDIKPLMNILILMFIFPMSSSHRKVSSGLKVPLKSR